ncbi:integrase core domain-containing protein [Streptomyces sp. NPDC048665]|uniref:integrase core domain-containing protein n=1 Tax=Streptomyces sp. NPDC048665 TaxID=3155490 RepID=UPI0034405556
MTVADFIADQRTSHRVPHAVSCRALEVSQPWFYKRLGRPPTRRDERRADLALADMAATTRGGDVAGVVFHTDRGSEFTSKIFGDACDRLGVVQSMGRVGAALDNAVAEATNSTLKVEYIHRHRFRTRAEARIKIGTWITDWYNPRRRHSACDWLSPIDYENRHHIREQQTQAA